MDIESEHLGIPETEYKCTVRLPAAEFQRIIRGREKVVLSNVNLMSIQCHEYDFFFLIFYFLFIF